MEFSFTEEQLDICKAVEELCRKKLNNNVFEDDEQSIFPGEKWKTCGHFGIHGLPIPEEYGGLEQSMLTTALAIQALARSCMDEGLVFSICAHMATCAVPILYFGTEEQKVEYLSKVCSGEMIGGNGITEANAGSDPSAISTKVTGIEEGYIIDGSKMFVTNGPVADLLIIYAKHPGGMKMADISAFIVGKDTTGLKIGQIFKKMGLRTSSICEIVLENCAISSESLLGRERLGMMVFNHSMLWERIIMAAYHIGAMEQQYSLVLKHTNTRKQFGQRILKFHAISDKLVEMKMRIEASKLMLYKTCWSYDNNEATMADASMLKLFTSEAKVKNSLEAVQIFGAYGYMKEYMVEKQLRDSIAAKIYSGTSEVQKLIISESLGGEVYD